MNVTADHVRDAMIAKNINEVPYHRCGVCGYLTKYIRRGDMLYFDAGCYCTDANNLEIREWQSAADWINMQSPVNAPLWAACFGIIEVEAK